jgi:hypothetical protein
MKGEIMNTTMTKRAPRKRGWLASVAVLGLSMAPHAWADSLLLAQTTLVSGSTHVTDSFTTTTAGTVKVTVQDLSGQWLNSPLSALSFAANSATQLLASFNATNTTSDSATFDVGAGTYFANIMATAGGTLNLGLYSLMLTFTPNSGPPPVPLPASDWMLLSGMFVLAGLLRVVRPLESRATAEA